MTVIGGPRLIAELGNWLVNVVQLPECPICMDPVVGVELGEGGKE